MICSRMSLDQVSVSKVMTRDVKVCRESDCLQNVCKIMQINDIGSVVVVSGTGAGGNVPVGILTERDIVNNIAIDPLRSGQSSGALMSQPLTTVTPRTSLRDALRLMVTRNIRRLPVTENNVLVGIATDKDIYREIAKSESLISEFVSDEHLMKNAEKLDQPFAYMLGEILHKRLGDSADGEGTRK